MRYVLKLEAIGDNYVSAMKYGDALITQLSGRTRIKKEIDMLSMGRKSLRSWVARIRGSSDKYGFDREFIKPQKDYSQANSVGSRGIYLYYALKPGIYEVNERLSWKRSRRYFLQVLDYTATTELTKDEVNQCLASVDLASTS